MILLKGWCKYVLVWFVFVGIFLFVFVGVGMEELYGDECIGLGADDFECVDFDFVIV